MTSSVSLPELGAAQRESRLRVGGRGGGNGRDAAQACGGVDWRAREPSGKGAAVTTGAQRERQHSQTSPYPGNAYALHPAPSLCGTLAALGAAARHPRARGCAQPLCLWCSCQAQLPPPKSPISLPSTLQERLRFKWERSRADFPGIERKTIFQVDDQTRYKYDTLLGRMPVD